MAKLFIELYPADDEGSGTDIAEEIVNLFPGVTVESQPGYEGCWEMKVHGDRSVLEDIAKYYGEEGVRISD
jgi:hypothetical protein